MVYIHIHECIKVKNFNEPLTILLQLNSFLPLIVLEASATQGVEELWLLALHLVPNRHHTATSQVSATFIHEAVYAT